jgi:NAD dependent epimerase/dehydratase
MAPKVLVTGAGGFIGSHLVEELVRRGQSVRALVMYNSLNSWDWLDTLPKDVLSQVEVVTGDIRDPHQVRATVKGCDTVYHLAALIAIPYSYVAPQSYIETNITGTLNVVQAARDLEISGRVIQTSTSEVYGTAQTVPILESHPLVGQSPYSATKIASDQIALSYYMSFQLPVSIVRPFNVYGPRQSARAIIPTVLSQIAAGKSEIKVGSITPTRDFTFVKDTARGFIDVGNSDVALGTVTHVSSNFEISIGDMIKLASEVLGRKVSVVTDQQRIRPAKSEVERLWGDNSKAIKGTSWRPEYGGVEGFKRGLKETAEWFAKPENLARYKTDIYNV